MIFDGRFRISFNRAGAAPLVWSIAPVTGEWDIAVAHVTSRAEIQSRFSPKSTPDDEDGMPSAWFEVQGRLEIVGNVAYIYPTWSDEAQPDAP